LRARFPIIDLREFKSFALVVTFLFSFLGTSGGIWFFVINTTVALTPNVSGWGLGLQPESASIFAALYTLGAFLGGIAVGKLLGKFSAATVGALIMLCQVAGFISGLAGLANSTLFGLAALLVGVGGGGTYAVVYNLVAILAEPHKQATMAALVTVGANIGGAVLPVAIFAVMNSNMSTVGQTPMYSLGAMQFAMILPAALALVLVVLAIALRRSLSTRAELLANTRN
jgi:MFS family permease